MTVALLPGSHQRDGVGGTGGQPAHVLPTLDEEVPGQGERAEAWQVASSPQTSWSVWLLTKVWPQGLAPWVYLCNSGAGLVHLQDIAGTSKLDPFLTSQSFLGAPGSPP